MDKTTAIKNPTKKTLSSWTQQPLFSRGFYFAKLRGSKIHAKISEFLVPALKVVLILANSGDPDEMHYILASLFVNVSGIPMTCILRSVCS